MWTVAKHPRDKRRYSVEWTGPDPVAWLTNGRNMGSYKLKRDAQRRADELNEERPAERKPYHDANGELQQ